MEILNACPICSSKEFRSVLSCKDYTVSGEVFTLAVCDACGFKFTNPRPSNDVLGNYYKSEDYISHSNTNKGLISKLYHLVRSYTLKRKLALIDQYVSRGTILDYGCGTGMFLQSCSDSGWKSYGLEPDIDARQIASKAGIVYDSIETLIKNIPDQNFDVITLWHVLEHVTDLERTLDFFKASLKIDGYLVIAVPNHRSFDAEYYQAYWAAYDVPRHLYHFHQDTIERLLRRFGFKLAGTHPMKFDSYYVSMLSEKYKKGSISYLNAFMTGLKSNWKAKLSNEYSSRIYVFKQF